MQNYKPCLFQTNADKGVFRDSLEWGIYVKSIPFKIFPEIKELAFRNWLDENGDDEYIPAQPVFKAYEMDCEFVFIGSHGTANERIRSFLEYLSNGGEFIIYDSYTQIGRKLDFTRLLFYLSDVLCYR